MEMNSFGFSIFQVEGFSSIDLHPISAVIGKLIGQDIVFYLLKILQDLSDLIISILQGVKMIIDRITSYNVCYTKLLRTTNNDQFKLTLYAKLLNHLFRK